MTTYHTYLPGQTITATPAPTPAFPDRHLLILRTNGLYDREVVAFTDHHRDVVLRQLGALPVATPTSTDTTTETMLAMLKRANAAELRANQLEHANTTLANRLAALPAIILEHVIENYGDPCDEGLHAFFTAADLPMPNRTRTVKVSWSENVYYEAEDEVECEWGGDSYVPTDASEELLREQAMQNPDYGDDNGDYECNVTD